MTEPLRGHNNNEIELESEAHAAALAYNRNANILYAPKNHEYDHDMDERKEATTNEQPAKEALPEFIKNALGDDKELSSEAKATGKVKIKNTNLNLIISL